MSVREMVEDVFNISFFFLQLKWLSVTMFDRFVKQNDVLMSTIMCYLCAKYE